MANLPGQDGLGEYVELQNILNLAMAVKDENDEYFVVAAWLESHDALIKELLSSPDVYITPRKRYTSTGRIGSVHFTADDGGRVFVCITKEGYPSRVAHMCLEEMQDHILLSPHNSASLVATQPHELSDAMLGILDDLVDKFDDPAQADTLTNVSRKIDVTTNVMQENISLLLENDAKLEEIEGKSEHMTSAADKFKSTSTELKKKMWWKLCKMRLCYALVVVAVLSVIIVPLSIHGSAASEKGGGRKGGAEGRG
eukprot:CAMPEP_0171848750 /NCGR_PEP_ID=MMETSP0992-20121227/19219_1 /TAXON_ID=483369 /ORGANISM="non described non described, Strain CCMP2098" /LENGTH=254 /DNA_ID=CAMNT_0012467733 /DNA_START=8 /DNA_END=768 /DNA_ORIENTATION=+